MTAQDLSPLTLAYLCSFAGTLAFLVVLEGGRAAVPVAADRWRHMARNGGLFVLAVFIADGLVLTGLMGVPFRLTESNGVLTSLALPAVAQFALGFVLLDLFDYGYHRIAHRVRWLWLLHAVHHSDPQLDATTGLRFHPAELAIEIVLKSFLLLGLGIPLWVEGARSVFLNPVTLMQHANVAYPAWVERWFAWLLVTPALHRLHHSPDVQETNTNYGAVFSFWDRLFGTYRHPTAGRTERFGLRRLSGDRWQTVLGMLTTPLRARGLGTL